jgi:D-sedoheptulose 7-phosphate isomerase
MDRLVSDNFSQMEGVLEAFVASGALVYVDKAGKAMSDTLAAGGKIISCGNGGSLCDAMHFAEELSARFRGNRRALAAEAISDPAYITCVGNDFGFENVFSRYVEAFGQKGDVLLAISTSGNSENVLRAAKAAKDRGMKVVALTGKSGGALANLCDIEIRVPWDGYSDRVQEIHIKVIHTLCQLVEHNLKLE